MRTRYSLSDFDYALPPELIAQAPSAARAGSRLLHVQAKTLVDLPFADFPRLVSPGDLVVFNDTRVVKARLFARRPTGGRVELLLEREVTADEAVFQLRASHPPRPGGTLLLPGDAQATVIERDGRFFRLRLDGTGPLLDYLERHGDVPLPPYIGRAADATDASRYQTVYARHPGAAAAPTAGLHFDDAMLAILADARHRDGLRHAPRRRRDVPAGRDRGSRRASDACRALPHSGRDRCRDRGGTRARRADRRHRHDQPARARVGRGRFRPRARGRRRNAPLHHAGLSLSRRRAAADEFPSADDRRC